MWCPVMIKFCNNIIPLPDTNYCTWNGPFIHFRTCFMNVVVAPFSEVNHIQNFPLHPYILLKAEHIDLLSLVAWWNKLFLCASPATVLGIILRSTHLMNCSCFTIPNRRCAGWFSESARQCTFKSGELQTYKKSSGWGLLCHLSWLSDCITDLSTIVVWIL